MPSPIKPLRVPSDVPTEVPTGGKLGSAGGKFAAGSKGGADVRVPKPAPPMSKPKAGGY
jgi:hypothetical protein